MLTKLPPFAVYSAQIAQQGAPGKSAQAKRERPRTAAGPKQEAQGQTSTASVAMQTVQEEDDDYVLL